MLPGDLLQHFFILSRLGEGSMCEVFLAFDLADYQFVAIKKLLDHHAQVPTFAKRMQREASIYEQIQHERIVGLVEADFEHEPIYIATEYIRGIPLTRRLRNEGGSLFIHDAIMVLEDVAEGLNAAHSRDIIHRDVRPDNIMIDWEGNAKLFDFGIAFADDQLVQTKIGDIRLLGTYASPEQITGQRLEVRSDLYSLGTVLYEMLTGHKLHNERTLDGFFAAFKRPVPPPSQIDDMIPPILDSLVLNMLALDINGRYTDCRVMLSDLARIRAQCNTELREKIFGKEADMELIKAKRLYEKGQYEEALKICQSIDEQDTERKAALYNLIARSAARMKRPDISLKFHEKASFLQRGKLEFAMDYFVQLLLHNELGKARRLMEQPYKLSTEKEAATQLVAMLDRWEDPELKRLWEKPAQGGSLFARLKGLVLGNSE